MGLFRSLTEDISDVVCQKSFLEALFSCRINAFSDNARLIYFNVFNSRADSVSLFSCAESEFLFGKSFANGTNVFGSSSAAASDYFYSCTGELYRAFGEFLGRNIEFVC